MIATTICHPNYEQEYYRDAGVNRANNPILTKQDLNSKNTRQKLPLKSDVAVTRLPGKRITHGASVSVEILPIWSSPSAIGPRKSLNSDC
jgi:hypothetical protein